MKKHSAENEFLKIQIQETGAELCSLIDKRTGIEHIWQADPKIWSSHAPNLFPIIGALKDGMTYFEGKPYEIPKHGLVRHNKDIRLKQRTETELVFELIYSEDSLKLYPFKFDFRISFSLSGSSLQVKHQVINLGTEKMYFSLGGHPAFNICLFEKEKIEDYSIEFDQNMNLDTYLLNDDGLVSTTTRKVLENENSIRLSPEIFKKDALIFKNIASSKARLISKQKGEILSVHYSDFRNLGIWAKPGAPYVCIEPWLGIADTAETDQQLKNKEGIMELMPAQEFKAGYTIAIA
ncbi:aldose 1-epimerase family protein [Gramella sp. GC03-9]|uniref:Aldose 1-epimerase family protein n=1 Tax=Christiangramia oceanisediminis TaxID=2920386 RepID=A0A9X2KZF3_9FLAO|nr:aldose 1-epimerase family protein [Gramella oceanisediminis]MCP9200971.1 aldose 1-epimerase family protein [Gramella oceanisediminis]